VALPRSGPQPHRQSVEGEIGAEILGELGAPQGVAESHQGDRVGERQQPVEGVGHQGQRDADDTTQGEQSVGPAGEDKGPVERDAEQQATAQVGGASQPSDSLQGADVTLKRAATGVENDHVVDETPAGGGDVGPDVGGAVGLAHDGQVAESEQRVTTRPQPLGRSSTWSQAFGTPRR
jgi:hypothetical protein